ncbi:unnamed protein product [Cunninghamella blakesleeana]
MFLRGKNLSICGKISYYTKLQKSNLQRPTISSFLSSNQFRFYTNMSSQQPRILTVGTGAIGAIYSWRLSLSSEITAVCRSNYEAVKKDGFNIDSKKFGKDIFKPHHVVRTVEEAVEVSKETPYDYVLVTLKALPEVYNIPNLISSAITPKKTAIVLIQNGLGVEEAIVERFPDNPIISIVAYIGTSQTKPGHISMVGTESLIVGNYLPSKADNTKEKEQFMEILSNGNVNAVDVDDVERVRWQKLFWNSAFSPVCTLTGMNTSELLRNEAALNSVKNIMKEVIMAANAYGYDFEIEEQMKAMIERTEATATNYKPSMQLDFERKQPMEVTAILGAPLRYAKAKGLEVPHLELIHQLCSAANAKTLLDKKSNL